MALQLTTEQNVAADDTPQEFTPTPAGSHRDRVSDADDATYLLGSFILVPEEWFRLASAPQDVIDGNALVRETRILWRIARIGINEGSSGHYALFNVYQSDKSTLVASMNFLFTEGSVFNPVDMPTLNLVGEATNAAFPLYLRIEIGASNIIPGEHIRIARLRTQYLYGGVEGVPARGIVSNGLTRGVVV